MLTLGHAGAVIRPHDLAGAWNILPLIGLVVVASVYVRGQAVVRDPTRRRAAFGTGMTVLAVAVVSPLDALASVLLSAHMVQHVLLVLVAAPLLSFGAPGPALLRGATPPIRSMVRRARRAVGLDAGRLRALRSPTLRWVLYVAVFWGWHAAAMYGAAVENVAVHALEHAMFLTAGVLAWNVVVGRMRASREIAVIGVFALAVQNVILAALLTFSRSAWYAPYVAAAPSWGIDPLADQRLAGVIMWVPGGLIHVAIGIGLVVAWLGESDGVPAPSPNTPLSPASPGTSPQGEATSQSPSPWGRWPRR